MKKANSSVTQIVGVLHCAIGVAGWLLVAGVFPAQAQTLSFDRASEPVSEPYTTPEEPNGCWKKPGPVAGPFPALLNAGLTDDEREQLQKRVEKIHRSWPKDRDYLAPPTVGTLCELDPALLVTPPKGKEAGYVPIATRQEWGGAATPPRSQ
jgi:hypothetical protein